MFKGEFTYSLDDKGRMVLPSAFRAHLRGTIVVVKGFENNLYVYDEDEWKKQEKVYAGLSDFKGNARKLKLLVFSGICEVLPDKQGRIKVSSSLLKYAGVEKEVVMVGMVNHVEIWAKERWGEFLSSYEAKIGELAEEVQSSIPNKLGME